MQVWANAPMTANSSKLRVAVARDVPLMEPLAEHSGNHEGLPLAQPVAEMTHIGRHFAFEAEKLLLDVSG